VSASLPHDWLPALRSRLLPQPDHRPESWRLGGTLLAPNIEVLAQLKTEPMPAAVLIPLFVDQSGAANVLLTHRAPNLTHHAGQISFPGGRVEPTDAMPLAAALRETAEEVGIGAEFIEPLGYLPDHLVLTGFRITPVVALLRSGFVLNIDEREVASLLEIPLLTVCDLTSYVSTPRQLQGRSCVMLELRVGEHAIWGATAGMLLSLRARVLGAAA
jgi:8-oxo-dGTP pyrophosphatase MutT (NUDIX family)